jgi:hypothetical protein
MLPSLTSFFLLPNHLLWLSFAALHVFPEGYVDRTLGVVVRDRTVCIEYSIGMNDDTMQLVMNHWQASVVPRKAAPETDPSSDGEITSDQATSSPAIDSSSSGTSNAPLNSRPLKPSPDSANEEFADEEFANDQQLAAEFRAMAIAHLSKNLIVSCNGKRLIMSPTSGPPRLRRHMSVTVEYEAILPPETSPVDLSISDENMQNLDGAIRLSLKASGQSVLTRSNVAPILVRAERVELGNLDDSSRQQAQTIKAQIVQVPID